MSEQNVPAQWRKIPTVVRAAQWDGTSEGFRQLRAWAGDSISYQDDATGTYLLVATLEGNMRLPQGWWLIEGIESEFYPCKPSVFAATYEEPVAAAELEEVSVAEIELVSGEPVLRYIYLSMAIGALAVGLGVGAIVFALTA